MHYYPHHIGDFLKDTANLTDGQSMAYLRMIWRYYLDESPISGTEEDLAFAFRTDEKTVRLLLKHYFSETPKGWRHKRIDATIADWYAKSEKARASANARWNNANAMRTQCERSPDAPETDATQYPIPNTHKEGTNVPLSAGMPTCPQKEILDLYSRVLPSLSQPRVWEGNRAAMLRQRWLQAAKPSSYSPQGYSTVKDGLEWWESFFRHIANDTSLYAGFESGGRVWKPDLEWICKAGNFAKIIDGKYSK
jgi:uncharacterized protein YdaU (DUF1376 family)